MDIRLKDGTTMTGVLPEDLEALVKLGVIPHSVYERGEASAFEALSPKLETGLSTPTKVLDTKGTSQKTTILGNQVWMAENLAIDDGGEGIYHNPENNETYYTYDAAMRVSKSIPGWHLPTALEWNEAALACGAKEIPYRDGSNPNLNDYKEAQELNDKLNVKLVGYLDIDSFVKVSFSANFWTATENSPATANAYCRYFTTDASMISSSNNKASYACSVRLIKDSA